MYDVQVLLNTYINGQVGLVSSKSLYQTLLAELKFID